MPCSPNPSCPNIEHFAHANFLAAAGTGTDNDHYAHMGWVGFVVLDFDPTSSIYQEDPTNHRRHLRVTGADINLSQEVNTADVIDGRVDRTAYWLGPKIVEGTLNMPVVADMVPSVLQANGTCPNEGDLDVAGQLINNLWDWAVERDKFGRMCNFANAQIRYANHAAFTFDRCIPNTFTFNVTQGDMCTFDIAVIGRSRSELPNPETTLQTPSAAKFLSPARVLTWNDITVNGVGGCGNPEILFWSNQIREFSLEINNNVDRFFTLNGTLYPVDINAGKREITGSMTLLGMNHTLRQVAERNQSHFTEKNEIRIAAYIPGDLYDTHITGQPRDWFGSSATAPNSIFSRRLASVVFSIEEVSMTNEVLETTVNYLALASDKDAANYEAMIPAPSCGYPAWGTE